MASTRMLRKLVLTAVVGIGTLTSVAWGDDGYRYSGPRDEWREHRDEARERRAREERREREQRQEREWREHHGRDYDRR